jgi:hypothetical protein
MDVLIILVKSLHLSWLYYKFRNSSMVNHVALLWFEVAQALSSFLFTFSKEILLDIKLSFRYVQAPVRCALLLIIFVALHNFMQRNLLT